MDDDRWTSIRRCREAYVDRSTEVPGYPQEAHLEVSARCNLRCVMCPLTHSPDHWPGGRPAILPPELFARLRPIFPTLVRAQLFGLGEPLLNRHLDDYIRELSDAGVEVWFTTNATLIDDRRADELARAGAGRIAVSADGATAETFEAIRRRGRFPDLLRGLEALGRAARRHGRPHLTLNFVAMASNLAELPAMARLCGETGVAELNVEPLYDWGQGYPPLGELYRREHLGNLDDRRVAEIFAEAEHVAAESGVALRRNEGPMASAFGGPGAEAGADGGGLVQIGGAPATGALGNSAGGGNGSGPGWIGSSRTSAAGTGGGTSRLPGPSASPNGSGDPWPCTEPWSTVWISSEGFVSTCCLNGTAFGNLYRQSFDEIWNGSDYQAFRRKHLDGTGAPGCGPCVANGRQLLSPWFAAVAPGTARPLLAEPPPAATPRAPWLDGPLDGETVTDPLVVTGRLRRWDPRRLLFDGRWLPRLELDGERLPRLAGALIDGDRFVATVHAPYLTEGAHVLSLARGGDRGPGWSRRTVLYRRPPEATDGTVTATGRAAVGRRLPQRVPRAEIRIGGRPWPNAQWLCGYRDRDGWVGVAVTDLTSLAPGSYDLEIEPAGQPPSGYRLVRLAG